MPITSLAADLAYVLKDVGESFTHGTDEGYGKLRVDNLEGVTESGIQKLGVRYTFIVRDDDITAPTVDQTIVINGASYKIRDPNERLSDGTRHLDVVPA